VAAGPLLDRVASNAPRRGRGLTPLEHAARQAAARRAAALQALGGAIDQAGALQTPAPVTDVCQRKRGVAPKLPATAFELARQVYYLNHGTISDCARAIIAAGLSDTDGLVMVRERLRTWWKREGWPKRPTLQTFAIRDANHDGGLYRSERVCVGAATGNGPAPKGKRCPQSALPDSDYCFHHDPRPEYVRARRIQAARLAESRRFDMVSIEPLRRWMDAERKRLLAQTRATRRVHPNNTGWCLLAHAMRVDQSVIDRMMNGTHNGAAARNGRGRTDTIRASTVVRYLEPTGVAFRDIYGFDPPPRRDASRLRCPRCGGPKNPASNVCRDCYDAEGTPCSYVNRSGVRCNVPTKHESGVCAKCRRITERVHKPRRGRASYVSMPMLILATGEYRDIPNMAWVARRMWAANAAGVSDVFKSQKALASSLVKQFRKRGLSSTADAERAHAALVAEHGELPWPDPNTPLETAGMVPFAPFGEWLQTRRDELGSYAQLARRIRMNPDHISQWLRGVATKTTVRRATVDRALEAWADGTTFTDLYGSEVHP